MNFKQTIMQPIVATEIKELKQAAIACNALTQCVGIGVTVKDKAGQTLVEINFNDFRAFFHLGILYGKTLARKK